jgi:hypothetical protein
MYHNYDNSQEVTKVPKPIGCIIALVGLWILSLLAWYFLSMWIMIYKDTPIRGKIIFLWIILIAICWIVFKILKLYRLNKAIESWSAIRKKAKIIDFQFAKNGGGWEDDTSEWYYVVVFDWENDYDGMFHRWARIVWKPEDEIKKDKFYEENWITLDLKDKDKTRKQLDDKISELKLELPKAKFIKDIKLKMKIWELENKKKDLEPYHLHTREWDFYIWDEYTILIDPDDPSNYTFETGRL